MRAVVVVSLFALLYPASATAQNAAPTAAAGGGGLTKDQYVEQARQRAGKRFDKLDKDRDGVLSAEEQRAARPKKKRSAQ